MKKFFVMMLAFVLLIAGCGEQVETHTPKGKLVGVAMPNQTSQRWIQDGDYIKAKLEEKGYTVDLKYAEDDNDRQVKQIFAMIDKGASCLVIASIDSTKLLNILAKAKEKNIPVIAYDRLLMDTDSVSYYATFDNKGVGILIGRYIEDKLNLRNTNKTFNAEFFAGSPDDNNAYFFNEGIFEVLQPYIDNGKLQIPSGETDFNSIAIMRWLPENAYARMKNILQNNYTNQKVDVIVSPFDGISHGVINALQEEGYTVGKDFPLITGQDADLKSIKYILSGEQSMTIFKDTRVLAEKCAAMVEAVLEGKAPEINDTISYDNHKIVVPSYLCQPVIIDKTNIDKELIESGYYTKEEVNN